MVDLPHHTARKLNATEKRRTRTKQKQKASSYAPSHYLTLLYEEYQSVKIIDYEENHLADKYIDFRMIVKEYKEGILLFQLMEEEVWKDMILKLLFKPSRV